MISKLLLDMCKKLRCVFLFVKYSGVPLGMVFHKFSDCHSWIFARPHSRCMNTFFSRSTEPVSPGSTQSISPGSTQSISPGSTQSMIDAEILELLVGESDRLASEVCGFVSGPSRDYLFQTEGLPTYLPITSVKTWLFFLGRVRGSSGGSSIDPYGYREAAALRRAKKYLGNPSQLSDTRDAGLTALRATNSVLLAVPAKRRQELLRYFCVHPTTTIPLLAQSMRVTQATARRWLETLAQSRDFSCELRGSRLWFTCEILMRLHEAHFIRKVEFYLGKNKSFELAKTLEKYLLNTEILG